MFCSKCGKENPDSSKFCCDCGAPLAFVAAPAETNVQAGSAAGTPVMFPDPERLVYRVKCPSCGTAYDAKFSDTCKKCGTPHTIDLVNNGFLQIYRMGHFSGSMAKQSIYLNREGMGFVGNAGSVLIELPPGIYNVHLAISTLRNCEDISVNIEPGKRVCVKSQVKMGVIKNKILLHVVDPSEMPEL